MRYSALCLMIFCLGGCALTAPKLAYIDSARVYGESAEGMRIAQDLQREFAPERERLQKMAAQYRSLEEKLASAKESERRNLRRVLETRRKNYLLAARTMEEEYSLRRMEEFTGLQQRANRAIAQISADEGYDWIDDNVVLAAKKYDITDRVIRILDDMSDRERSQQ